MRRTRRSPATGFGSLLAFVLAGSAPLAAGGQSSAPLDALTIYDRARAAVAARRLPPFIAYTQYAAVIRHGHVEAQRERIIVRMADGKINSTRIADSPNDRVDTTPAAKDRPLVYPTTTFGLVKRSTGEQPSAYESLPSPGPTPTGEAPAVIGRVTAVGRDYDPTLIGVEHIGDASVYALALAPRFDPRHHPIRELDVDTTTFDPRRIAIEMWAQAGPVRSRPTVIIDFAPVAGTWLISRASMNFVLRFAFLNYGGSAELRISDVTFPAAEPDWMFDPHALAAHPRNLPNTDP